MRPRLRARVCDCNGYGEFVTRLQDARRPELLEWAAAPVDGTVIEVVKERVVQTPAGIDPGFAYNVCIVGLLMGVL